jgi:dynein heavy chain
LTYTDLAHESISKIFTTIITAFYYNFSQEIKDAVAPLVAMTLRVYDQVLNGPLKPTPNKSHYTFNLRDISRVAQGLCVADRRHCYEPVHAARLWVHENKRVFGDRLRDDPDRAWLDQLLAKEACQTLSLAREEVFNAARLVFGDYMDGIEVEQRIYRQVPDLTVLVEKVTEYLEDYNGSVKK